MNDECTDDPFPDEREAIEARAAMLDDEDELVDVVDFLDQR